MTITEFYDIARKHQKSHDCSAVPYASGNLLTTLVMSTGAKRILEIGTGIGYSAVCLAQGNSEAHIDTIEKKSEHIDLAKQYFQKLGVSERITTHTGFAEDVMLTFTTPFDLIFYDGFIPQKKFVETFYSLLRDGGLLVTTNLFLGDVSGGRYVKLLQDQKHWQTGIIGDTAISVKIRPIVGNRYHG